MKRVLILYGTRYNTTKDTSEKISLMLKKKGIEVDLIDINEEDPPLTTFDGVIIGTGIKITMWVKKIKKYMVR